MRWSLGIGSGSFGVMFASIQLEIHTVSSYFFSTSPGNPTNTAAAHTHSGFRTEGLDQSTVGHMSDHPLNKVLIIDDDQRYRQLLVRFFHNNYRWVRVDEYDPVARGRPDDAFDWSQYDLLLLDFQLGVGENGLDWLRSYKKDRGFPATIVMTDKGDEDLAIRSIKLGAQDYVSKRKLRKERLMDAVVYALEKRSEEVSQPDTAVLRRSIFNRILFHKQLQNTAQALQFKDKAVVLLVEVDTYRQVQESEGFSVADRLTAELAEKLIDILSKDSDHGINVTRIGDDLLGILVTEYTEEDRGEQLAAQICGALTAAPLRHDGENLRTTVSIGVVLLFATSGLKTSDAVLNRAYEAVRVAQQEPGNAYHIDNTAVAKIENKRTDTNFDVSRAIKENRIQPHFQPLACVSNPAAAFDAAFYEMRISLIGLQGQVVNPRRVAADAWTRRLLDRWVIRDGFSRLLAKKRLGSGQAGLFIRLSQETLTDKGLSDWLRTLIQHIKAPQIATSVVFEILPQDFLSHKEIALPHIESLREIHGASFALFDVSSASTLEECSRDMSFNFVTCSQMLSTTTRGAAELKNLVDMARDSGTLTVAQRIENGTQLALAIRTGVDFVQGYFVHEPEDDISDDELMEVCEFG